LGEHDLAKFPWLEPPPQAAVAGALTLLRRLGALDDGGVTDMGRALARLPVHPRLGRLLLEGQRLGDAGRAALAAALLAERDPLIQSAEQRRDPSESDVLDRVEALEAFERGQATALNRGAARFVLRARDQMLRELPGGEAACGLAEDALLRALLAAFPDRVVRRREAGSRRGLMVGGRGVRLVPTSAVTQPELFLAIDVDAGDTEALVRQASAIRREWLTGLTTQVEVAFDPATERVSARKRVRYE